MTAVAALCVGTLQEFKPPGQVAGRFFMRRAILAPRSSAEK
jgi:hypothetical protein